MKSFLNQLQHASIEAAIGEAERQTSGEIRVMVFNQKTDDALATAAREFVRLGMHKTALRNGVLIFVAPDSRSFAIHADKAIYETCGAAFWAEVAAAMETDFRASRFTEGIVAAVLAAGNALGRSFPHQPDDKNELPNKVIDCI